MIEARLRDVATALDGRLIDEDVGFRGVSIDTRSLQTGNLFVALRGARVDAHQLLGEARARGASAALVVQPDSTALPQMVVADTQAALARLAAWQRKRLDARVIGITGSNGKTTVKTLTATILGRCGRTHVNAGNLNNEIGLPLSLLEAPAECEFLVLEMGAGKPGDIEELAMIAQPSIGLVNNVAPAHLERMGSLDGVAETKGALYAALPAQGVAVINADDAYAEGFAKRSGASRRVRFGLDHPADFSARDIRTEADASTFVLVTPLGERPLRLPLPGMHNVRNALAAAALAASAGASLQAIVEGLGLAPAVAGRLVRIALPGGAQLIDDSYNANPGSTAAAIELLAGSGGERWLVLGDMRELGPSAEELHRECGARARAAGIERLFAVGQLASEAASAFGLGGHAFKDQAALIDAVRSALHPDALVLVKGSRGSSMEQVVLALTRDSNREAGVHVA